MAYTPFTWHDGPGGGTPIVASRLNAIEQGIADAHDVTDALEDLSSYVPGIIRSAVVDHNLDVPGGFWDVDRYIRYESGLQECWGQYSRPLDYSQPNRQWQGITWYTSELLHPLPASVSQIIDFRTIVRPADDTDIDHPYYNGPYNLYFFPQPTLAGEVRFQVTTMSGNILEWPNQRYYCVGWWKP